MQALIPLSRTEIGGDRIETVNARELHAFLENGDAFANWIKDRVQQYGFTEGIDFTSYLENSKKPSGGAPRQEYALTLDMAKELAMVERNEKGKQARQYFIECEKALKQPRELADPKALRGLLLSYTERVI